MTITKADEIYMINDTCQDYTVEGSISFSVDGKRSTSIVFIKDDQRTSATISTDGRSLYVELGPNHSIILDYLSKNLDDILNFERP